MTTVFLDKSARTKPDRALHRPRETIFFYLLSFFFLHVTVVGGKRHSVYSVVSRLPFLPARVYSGDLSTFSVWEYKQKKKQSQKHNKKYIEIGIGLCWAIRFEFLFGGVCCIKH